MRIGATVCFLIALALVAVGVVNWWRGPDAQPGMGEPFGMLLAAGLMAVLGLWLSQQPKKDDQGPDEGRP